MVGRVTLASLKLSTRDRRDFVSVNLKMHESQIRSVAELMSLLHE